MQLILKAQTVKNPGSRGGKFWIDEHGKTRYDEKPSGIKKPLRYLARVTLADGTVHDIEPDAHELDENGQVIGGQPAIRDIINRKMLGEYGFYPAGHKHAGKFWQKKGILFEYKPRRIAGKKESKIVVDPIQLHAGYTLFDFRDASVERAYGKGLPAKISKFEVAPQNYNPSTGETEKLPEKPDPDAPALEGTSDIPVEDIAKLHNVPPRLPQTQVALDKPLQDTEDPIAIATAYLDAFLNARKPSQAKTPAGQARAREDRKHQFDEVAGARRIVAQEEREDGTIRETTLPQWAVNKYASAEELQNDLSRDGRPLTTLITLGMWNPNARSKRFTEQLTKEWMPFIRRWARRMAGVYSHTDTYRQMDVTGEMSPQSAKMRENSQHRYMLDRERDLVNTAVAHLLDEANKYVANDESVGQYSRFDLRVQNVIKNELERHAKTAARELGASAGELSEEDEFRTPKMISSREHFELRHLEPHAKKILHELLSTMPERAREVLRAQLWLDDGDLDYSKDKHAEEREPLPLVSHKQALNHLEKRGKSKKNWARPWTRQKDADTKVESVGDRLAHLDVTLRNGQQIKLGMLTPEHQRYYLDKWHEEAMEHVAERLKTPSGGVTPEGAVVEKWLRLEAKVASYNHREIVARTKLPIAAEAPTMKPAPMVEHIRAQEQPSVKFFGTNRELAVKLGVANDLDVPIQMRHMNMPRQAQQNIAKLDRYHKMAENLQHVPNIEPVLEEAKHAVDAHNIGHWTTDAKGNAEWSEAGKGVVALHNAAVKKDAAAFADAANAIKHHLPDMVVDYTTKLKTGETPTTNDLATWKTRAHAAYRTHVNRLHIAEFERDRRVKKSTWVSWNVFRKSFDDCVNAYDRLCEVLS